MKDNETYKRKAFLQGHPPISSHIELVSGSSEVTLLAGTVIGFTAAGFAQYGGVENEEPIGILAEDVIVPVSGNAFAEAYLHAHVVASELIFDASITAEKQKIAIKLLRKNGIFAN